MKSIDNITSNMPKKLIIGYTVDTILSKFIVAKVRDRQAIQDPAIPDGINEK